MTLSRHTALLFSLLLLATASYAQTPLGQPTLDEQKVQIWCATVKFVYEDTGRPNLKNSLQCGSSLKAFENSIKADSQRVYSALYEPLEGRGVMYKGLGSDKSRIQKLATEIINRLKASPARRKDPARMQRVDALAAMLTNYVQNGTPPGEVTTATATESAPDTTATSDESTAMAPAAGADTEVIAAPAPRGGESLMSKFFAPLALIISLLSLFLYVLMRRSLDGFQKELSSRIDKRREEIMALQSTPATGASGPARLTPELQRQIEQLVQQRVAQELSKRPGNANAGSGDGKQRPNQPQNQNQKRAAEAPRPAPVPVVEPEEAATPFANISQAPSVFEAPASLTEVPTPPAAVPAGPPAADLRDEFESLVPPVQLPTPERPMQPGPALRYVKVPVNGGFSEYDLTDQPQHDSIYQISLNPQNPDTAIFRVNPNPAVHAYAIQSAQFSLREACRYQQPSGPVTRIITDEDGTLRRVGGAWQIEQKAAIRFE